MLDWTTPNDGDLGVFRTSMLARPALVRVAVTAALLVPLWLCVLWAVAVP